MTPTTEVPPLQHRPVMRQSWQRASFLHWAYDPSDVQRLLPRGLQVDTHDGMAWVGLVAFEMVDIALAGLPPVPHLGTFPETNVRTYVRGPDGTPGVWFHSLEAERLVPVLVARGAYRLPYFWSQMQVTDTSPRYSLCEQTEMARASGDRWAHRGRDWRAYWVPRITRGLPHRAVAPVHRFEPKDSIRRSDASALAASSGRCNGGRHRSGDGCGLSAPRWRPACSLFARCPGCGYHPSHGGSASWLSCWTLRQIDVGERGPDEAESAASTHRRRFESSCEAIHMNVIPTRRWCEWPGQSGCDSTPPPTR